ncbi:MAG: hypothetical protein IH616_02515 [Gemmatimonadales bacterium]|nr:hypothetical protein [Gemmatimonadales bacterium]
MREARESCCSVVAGVTATALLLAACAGGEAAGSGVTVRDSAGIEIVESTTGAWGEDSGWKVADVPDVDIGVLEGAEEYQLFQVRDARRLADGRIVIANGGTNELRFYDARGRHLSSTGRDGEGPGEFKGLGWIRPFRGDSLAVYDFNLGRISVFDGDGRFARTLKIAPVGEASFVIGEDVFADGVVLAKSPLIFAGGFESGLNRRDEVYHTHSPTGERLDSLGAFPGPEQFIETGGSGNRRFVAITSLPFGRTPTAEAFGTQFCFGASDTYEIACYERKGTLVRLIRRLAPPRPVTPADVDAWVRSDLAEIEDADARRDAERRYAEMPLPETMPAYATFTFDASGDLWVREFTVGDVTAWPWTVFDRQGRMLGTVTLPAEFRVTQVGNDFVLGLWHDDFEVEHVRLYGLVKD